MIKDGEYLDLIMKYYSPAAILEKLHTYIKKNYLEIENENYSREEITYSKTDSSKNLDWAYDFGY